MVFNYVLLLCVLTASLQLSGADGFHLQIQSSVDECRACVHDSPPGCRLKDCSVPLGQPITISCVLSGSCDPLSHPLNILVVNSEGASVVTSQNFGGLVPGPLSLQRPDQCSLTLNLVSTPDTNNLVFQCAVSTNEVMEYSKAIVLAVRGVRPSATVEPRPAATSPTRLPRPSVSPPTTSTPSSETTSSSNEMTSSPSLSVGDNTSPEPVIKTECVYPLPTSVPNSSAQHIHSLHRLFIAAATLIALLLPVVL